MNQEKTTDTPPQDPAAAESLPSAAEDTQPDRQAASSGEAQEAVEPCGVVSREAELQDQMLRLLADFDNFRKRTMRDKAEASRRATEDLMRELLPVLDHFSLGLRAVASNQGMNEALVSGYEMAANLMNNSLLKFGLKPIEAEGRVFDPNFHEAVAQLPSDEQPEGVIVSEIRKGYMLGDRLLRASRVAVSSGPAKAGRQKEQT